MTLSQFIFLSHSLQQPRVSSHAHSPPCWADFAKGVPCPEGPAWPLIPMLHLDYLLGLSS